jgi:hypothetical protein
MKGSCCVLMGLTAVSLATIFACVLVVSNRYPGSVGLGANTPTPVKRFSGGFSGAVFRDTGDSHRACLSGRLSHRLDWFEGVKKSSNTERTF